LTVSGLVIMLDKLVVWSVAMSVTWRWFWYVKKNIPIAAFLFFGHSAPTSLALR